jgi:hypothetical protein
VSSITRRVAAGDGVPARCARPSWPTTPRCRRE